MNPFFDCANFPLLEEAANAWVGTPFAPAGAVRGDRGGACCHRLCAAVLIDCQVPLSQDEFPDAGLSRATHHPGSMMADWLRAHPDRFAEVPKDAIGPGDLLLIKAGIGVHHMAVALSHARMLHTWQHAGAHLTRYDDPSIFKRIYAAFRPLKPSI